MTRPLRIGIFVIRFPKRSETFIVTKVLKLLEAGFDVQVFAFSESNDWDAFDVLAGREDVRARVHVIPPVSPLGRALVGGGLEVVKAATKQPAAFARYVAHTWRTRGETQLGFLKSVFQRIHFVGRELDVLHIEFDAQGIGVVDLKEYLGCHVLLSGRGTFHHMFVDDHLRHAAAYLFRYVDGYHFISGFLDGNMRKLGLPEDVATWRIEPAIDLSLFTPQPRGQHSGPIRIISVGRLEWTKGHEHALDAIARVRDAGVPVEYTIYGDGSYTDPIEYAIRQHRLTGIARIGGALRREQMPDVYAGADIMVHAALGEGFCNAVIEAQAMELPVVTTDAGGLPENVEHGVTGIVVPRRDPVAMADAILELARDPERRTRMGRAGRERALARFNLDRQAEAFVKLYGELARSPRRVVVPSKRT